MAKPVKQKRTKKPADAARFSELAILLAELGRNFYDRGWALGTSGNFSAVICREPLRLAITWSGVDKGKLTADQIVQIDARGSTIVGSGRPSVEAKVHLAVVRARGAGAVLHTHSVWSTILSEAYAGNNGISLEGYEMLKGLAGVQTHEHREWLPILENSQDWVAQARAVEETLQQHPHAHGFLLRRHGLYTWGQNLEEAKRHVEILEFLLEVLGRTHGAARHSSRAVGS
ncbi:methylthioribulose 1-phosphate dehydratase [Acidobacteriia bacterium AH_259_A11_L15]|nr:methylthioribulose 1-phosphate dehydratase [Acidobacteriia bacterium AH_259_A11_L15]